jgi:hypothetical protein
MNLRKGQTRCATSRIGCGRGFVSASAAARNYVEVDITTRGSPAEATA